MTYAKIEKQDGVAVVWLDQPDEKINKISLDLLDIFEDLFEQIENDEEIKAVVLISKKEDNFIAGADLEELVYMPDREKAETLSRRGHILLNRMAEFKKPVVAALHGATLGGGLEVALACSCRIATDDPKTVLALPEVRLGLLPGGEGTQRLPRLVGLQAALDMMLTGKNIYPRQAKRMGLVDDLIHPYGLLEAAKKAALDLAEHPRRRKKRQSAVSRILDMTPFGRRLIYKKAREMVEKKTWGHYPAPFKIIDCVEAGMEKGMEAGLKAEEEKFGELVMSDQAHELIRIFFNMTALKKNPLKDFVKPVQKIGVLGAGLMGAGIANVSAVKGMEVLLKDISYDALGQGEKSIWNDLTRKVIKGGYSAFQRDQLFSRISGTITNKGLEKADLVIEAVFEDLDLKKKILAETEAVMKDDAIFASNTSSLPITSIAEASQRPEQVIGMHYFSPVPQMPLLEIIVTEKTAGWVTATAIDVGIRQGKTVIVVHDGPGFYTTRILAPLMNEALALLEEGADIKQIDRAMREFGFPVGPITLLDEVGIDVGAHVSEILAPLMVRRGVTSNVLNIFEQLGKADYKGRKNNKGFYRYGPPTGKRKKKKGKEVNNDIYDFFGGKERKMFDTKEIQDRLSLIMVNEAAYCLQEEILRSPSDGDIGAIFGLGFPPFLGGPFRYMDRLDPKQVLSLLEALVRKHGARFKPAQIIRDKAHNNEQFYQE
ncbi:MAG: fatty acid oxidation complex subunit alpha FadJ [Deltaproteobacteria bacterium]|nr:fatty acid oxidation complex subunit alpha FadJ [Deltaproteobacteria bacterium]